MNLDFTQARDGEWQWHHLGHMHVHVYFTCKRIFRNTSWVITADSTHTHTHSTALCLGLLGWASIRKVKPTGILLKQETLSSSGISWAICRSAPRCRQPRQHPSTQFLQAGCPSCHPTNGVKALRADSNVTENVHHTSQLPFFCTWTAEITQHI